MLESTNDKIVKTIKTIIEQTGHPVLVEKGPLGLSWKPYPLEQDTINIAPTLGNRNDDVILLVCFKIATEPDLIIVYQGELKAGDMLTGLKIKKAVGENGG